MQISRLYLTYNYESSFSCSEISLLLFIRPLGIGRQRILPKYLLLVVEGMGREQSGRFWF